MVEILTPKTRFSARRIPGRKTLDKATAVPIIGPVVGATVDQLVNRDVLQIPIERWRIQDEKIRARRAEKKKGRSKLTDIPLEYRNNKTLAVTAFLDAMFYLMGPEWAEERLGMAKGLRDGFFGDEGYPSDAHWTVARSRVGPQFLSYLMQGVLQGKPMMPSEDIFDLWEHNGDLPQQRTDTKWDIVTGVVGGGIAGGVTASVLSALPEVTRTVSNPAVVGKEMTGLAIGAALGGLAGAAVDVKLEPSMGKLARVFPWLMGGGGAVMGRLIAEAATHNLRDTVQVTEDPLSQFAWAIPAVAIATGLALEVPRHHGHKMSHEAIGRLLHDLRNWRSMAVVWSNALTRIYDTNQALRSQEPDASAPNRRRTIAAGIERRNPRLAREAKQYSFRDPDSLGRIEATAGNTLKQISEGVMVGEMVTWDHMDFVRYDVDGIPVGNVEGLVPRPSELFAGVNREMLLRGLQPAILVKELNEKKDSIAALTVVSPTLASTMLSILQWSAPGSMDDTMYYGSAGMNAATRGYFVPLLRAAFHNMLEVEDSKRAELLRYLPNLGDLYKRSFPLGGLMTICDEPMQMKLLTLYSVAYVRGQGHKVLLSTAPIRQELEAIYGEDLGAVLQGIKGSKGLISDIGKAALESYRENPLTMYIFLADLTNAVEMIPTLLVSLPENIRNTIINGLKSLQRELADQVLVECFPTNKQEAQRYFTDDAYIRSAYTALTMLQETCMDEVIQPLVASHLASVSPIFAEADAAYLGSVGHERRVPHLALVAGAAGETTWMYSTETIDAIYQAERHADSIIHAQMLEFLHRGVLPFIVRQYIDRLRAGGRGEQFTDALAQNTELIAGYAFEKVHDDDLLGLIDELVSAIRSVGENACSNFGSLGSTNTMPPEIQRRATAEHRRALAMMTVVSRVKATLEQRIKPDGCPLQDEKIPQLSASAYAMADKYKIKTPVTYGRCLDQMHTWLAKQIKDAAGSSIEIR
ncbi:MAG: hypothetical protein WC489_04335 [Patescibacteria group bacterium]